MTQILLGILPFTLDKFAVFNTQEEKEKKYAFNGFAEVSLSMQWSMDNQG